MKKTGKLGIAMVGCGAISYSNAEAILKSESARLVCAVDAAAEAAERFGVRYSIPFGTSLEESVTAPEVDAVFICTPHYLHAPLAERAAALGKHVIVEKPMGTNPRDAQRIIAACEENRVLLSVCYCMRYWRAVQQARELIEKGALGTILGSEIVMLRDRTESYLLRNTWQESNPNWHGDRARSGGGMFFDNFSHYLDYFHFITGLEIEWVFAKADTFLIPADVEDSLFALCGYKNGASGMMLAGSSVRGAGGEGSVRLANSRQRLWGEDGQITLQPDFEVFSRKKIGDYSPNLWHRIVRYKARAAGTGPEERSKFVDMFARAVLEGEPLEITGEDGLRVMAVMDAVCRSAASGNRKFVKTSA